MATAACWAMVVRTERRSMSNFPTDGSTTPMTPEPLFSTMRGTMRMERMVESWVMGGKGRWRLLQEIMDHEGAQRLQRPIHEAGTHRETVLAAELVTPVHETGDDFVD